MNHKETFEDEGFVYELTVKASAANRENLHTYSTGTCYSCQWTIKEKQKQLTREIAVTDDECKVIIYSSVEAAVRGARDFLSI
jgi:hypothetical protein